MNNNTSVPTNYTRDQQSSSMECTSLTHMYVKKGYVQRDYSRGTKIRFETTLPSDFEEHISQQEFGQFIDSLNEIYLDAEKLKFCEGCLACLSAYTLYCCMETHKQKCMRRAREFISQQNELWKDRGMTVFDPMERGFRILEIQQVLNTQPNRPNK